MTLLPEASTSPAFPPHLSPSLRLSRGNLIAYELKFLLTEETARAVQQMASVELSLDPYADPTLANAYRTTTIYCDTPSFDVFFAVGAGRRRKHRLRRYGFASEVFLERKTKRGQRVRKRRSAVPLDELASLAHSQEPAWPGDWFRRRLLRDVLRPVCRLSYDRTAYTGTTAEGMLRVTMDRHLRGCVSDDWDLTPIEEGPDLLNGMVIVEFKFQEGLPLLGKRMVAELKLTPRPASKYRRFLAGTSLVPAGREDDA